MSDADKNELVQEGMEVDSSDSEQDEDELLERRAKELEKHLTELPYSYDEHVELVEIHQKLLNLPELRAAYENFRKHFPLTGKLWLDWIRTEIPIANTKNERKMVMELFDKAVDDYLSIDLWLEYVQYSIGGDLENTRKVFERAIHAAGLHASKGSLIWDAYREFELAHLSLLTDTSTDEWKEQAGRVAEIFKRQLSVPLLDMERTYIEWRVWTERLPRPDIVNKEQVDWAYKKATKYIDDYERYENKLKSTDSDIERLKIYREYIEDEGKLEITRCLYERAVADIPLNHELWLDFCMYFFKLSNYDAASAVSARALRNCPWADELWVFHLRVLELNGKTHDAITECLEKALASGFSAGHQYFQVWLAYLEHYRRITDPKQPESVEKLRKAFNKAHQHLLENFGLDADPESILLRFWAKVEAGFLHNMTEARKIWNDYGILKNAGTMASIWLELIALEQQYGDEKHVIKTYQRAIAATKDWPQSIQQSWLLYERQFGTIESIINATNTCKKSLKDWAVYYASQNHTQDVSKNKQHNDDSGKGKKRKISTRENEKKLKQVKITDDPPKPVVVEDDKKEFTRIDMDPEKQERSVFVSNLDYQCTEDELREFLGAVEELRLVKDRRGFSKGYAYCVLNNKSDADKTLKRDRELLKGRPVFISECKVDRMQREPMFRYATTQEKHKLFVKGLPLTMTQEQVEELFKKYGSLKEVRLVTYRNGRSKGLAYVEFNDSNDATKAIIATDNTEIDGFVISVAISDPPKRKNDTTVAAVPEFTRNSKTRLQVPLIPRSLQTPVAKEAQPSMSNEDFRKMLAKK